MKKILVVFTGGTIGSRIHNTTIDVYDEAGYFLLKSFQDKYNYEVEFEAIQPLNILSENVTPDHWKVLYDSMNEVDMSKYDGVIVTHGSDTLAYSSAIISFLFHYTQIPIVVTASNYALEHIKSNGMVNFRSSVDFVMNCALPGVFTIYQNDKGNNMVYLASRIMESDSYNDQYFSYGGEVFGEVKEGNFIYKTNRVNPALESFNTSRERLVKEDISFANRVLAIRPYPGLNYDYFTLSNKPKAILHSLYHSSTGCTSEFEYSLPKFIKRCKEEGIDFYLISFKNVDSDLYRTSKELLEAGAIPLQNISFEAAYAKLVIAYNQTTRPPKDYVLKELFYEFLPKPV